VHDRHFDFTQFGIIGEEFVSAFANAYVQYGSTLSLTTVLGHFSTVVNFLRWVVRHQEHLEPFLFSLRTDYRKAEPNEWEHVIALWRDVVIGNTEVRNRRKYNLIKSLNIVIKKMVAFGVVPKFSLIGPPSRFRPSRPTKTLAEVSVQGHSNQNSEILDRVLSNSTETGIDLQVKRDFLTTLVNENGKILGTPEAHANELMKINSRRLEAVRNCAEEDFLKWVDHWKQGRQLLERCDMSFEEIAVAARRYSRSAKRVFPPSDPAISLSRLIKFFLDHKEYQGQILGHEKGSLGRVMSRQLTRFGSPEVVQAFIFPHIDLTNSVITLLLCDTGANVSVARTLLVTCLQKTESSGYKKIIGTKTRSGGKLIIDELPINDLSHRVSSIRALETYHEISASIRKLAPKKISQFLFLYISKMTGEIRPIDGQIWANWFRVFRIRHPKISQLAIESKMIRPSVLMQAEFDKDAGIIASSAMADHYSLSPTRDYAFRYPNKMVWVRMIREFQALFQAVSIQSISGAAKKLGLTSRQVSTLFGEACRTGLGVACLNPKGGIQPGSIKGKVCNQLQKCHSCSNRIVVATTENLRDLIIWNDHLEKSRREWELTRPEKWSTDWLPWLVFTRVVIEQASRGRTAAEFTKAKLLAETRIRSGKVNLPSLW